MPTISRSGSLDHTFEWRLLPCEYGRWNSIYKRFARWSEKGVFKKLFEFCADYRDLENLILDSTKVVLEPPLKVVRAHHAAAGAPKKTAAKRIRH